MSTNEPNSEAQPFVTDLSAAIGQSMTKLPAFAGSVVKVIKTVSDANLKATLTATAAELSASVKEIRKNKWSFDAWYNVATTAANIIQAGSVTQSLSAAVSAAVDVVEPFAKLAETHKIEVAALSGTVIVATQSLPLAVAFTNQCYLLATDSEHNSKQMAKSVVYAGGAHLTRAAVSEAAQLAKTALFALGTVAVVYKAGQLAYLAANAEATPQRIDKPAQQSEKKLNTTEPAKKG
ncbi:MAG TPA: hypothetical protein VLG38_05270, partial [Gammaproteobacteria bacterium]|nr:hypothetical protein [Gammaproteobacteria bacterium]